MTVVGNHEAWFHFEVKATQIVCFAVPFRLFSITDFWQSYKHRFSMPGNNTFNKTGGANPPMYYSFDYGNVRVISYSCEGAFVI